MKIAVIGSGIAGLSAARALDAEHDVVIFEAADRLGGHACTVDVRHYGEPIAVDVGFIIFNRSTYPNFTRLLRELHVKAVPTRMGFSVSLDEGRFEWAIGGLGKLLAQRSNIVKPAYYKLLFEIYRFLRRSNADLDSGSIGEVSLRQYLARHRFGPLLILRFLVPMGASIWSASTDEFLDYPAEVLLGFMRNHGLLSLKQPHWLTVAGGSRSYVEALSASLRVRVSMGRAVARVVRGEQGPVVVDSEGGESRFDHVIVACHAPDALSLIDRPTDLERRTLGALKYSKNRTVLHGDTAVMPKRRAAWAPWNYRGVSGDREDAPVSVTYWMNVLQKIDERFPLFVTLNPPSSLRRELVFAAFDFEHPQFDRPAIDAQKRLRDIQGNGNLWFCGAYAGYGFHEDGITSGLEIAQRIVAADLKLLGSARIFR